MRPFAVDANAIALFQRERVRNEPASGVAAIEAISEKNCIALDNEKLCLQEWMDSAKGSFPFALADWISDMLVVGKIRYFCLAPNTCRKQLNSLGLPKDDHKWVRLALGCTGNVIVTGDVDFFEPSKKKAKSSVKLDIINKGSGTCSKSLKNDFAVDVVHTTAVVNYIATGQ